TAASDNQAAIRRDPMAMLPFCGYNMGDYWAHWLSMKEGLSSAPAIFRVNWFRKGEDGKFLWPGFSQNMRALQWIVERVRGRAEAVETPLGSVPRYQDINWTGLEFSEDQFDALMRFDAAASVREVNDQDALFDKFGDRLPAEMRAQQQAALKRLG
ncbi:MAG: phosphoenolpyruvate carboxykinase domain-containing protein, partial [Pseudomonadales bacterium]